ncbi:hypothetical protein [Crassaminicella indica]|uniref:DUF8052 domain-containing protein n=1 Tax=Crassaminicella indica TaxID=2855394 RepID=A0ABX8RE16_9CLOT|nr:hypothetical protein [Crassaminicella indica]QXM06639.1 hypothetical protein KVH43_02495 [Crassaminicella indica]
MKYTEYIEKIEKKLKRHFDIERDYGYKDLQIDLYAKYHIRNEKYMATKKIPIYAFENHEYCFIKYLDLLTEEKLKKFIEILKLSVGDFVHPHSEHMSSVITGVLVTDQEEDKKISNIVRKFKFHKSFAFGLKGWVDIRLILVHLGNGDIITNKKGKEVSEVYKL